MSPRKYSEEERIKAFWAKVEKTEACWLWMASKCQGGYGRFRVGGVGRKKIQAHRFAYELLVGPVPDNLDLDHLCRVRDCVNPAHLEPVTRRENLLRGETLIAAQVLRTHCPRGHPYDEQNTRVYRGMRSCRACDRRKQLERYHRKKAS